MSAGKSFVAKIEEIILKSTKPDYMDSQDKIHDFLSKKQHCDEEQVKSIFKSEDFNGAQVFTFGDKNAENTVLFVHGGAYIGEINYQHLLYCFFTFTKVGRICACTGLSSCT